MESEGARKDAGPVKVQVAVPSRNPVGYDLCGGLALGLAKMQQNPRYDVEIRMQSGFGVELVRNRIVGEFLRTDREYLLMIDDDMVPPEDLLDMTVHGRDVVGALYYAWDPRKGPFVAAYDRGEDGGYGALTPGEVERQGLREVALVGGGCLLVHRRVLEALSPPWFRFETDGEGRRILTPEDFFFCRNAVAGGIRVFLDTDRICGHIKAVDLRDVVALTTARRREALFDLLE